MKLYEYGPTRSTRARWILQELAIPFDAITIDLSKGENRAPEFLALNPAGKLPVLIDDDVVLTESGAIAVYLAEKYPEKSFIPKVPAERAAFFRWLFFTVTELEQPLWRLTRQSAFYPGGKQIPEDAALAREDFAAMAKLADGAVKGREFVAGDHVTVADFMLAFTLDWAATFRLLKGFPELARYADRMYARPAAPPRMVETMIKLRRQAQG